MRRSACAVVVLFVALRVAVPATAQSAAAVAQRSAPRSASAGRQATDAAEIERVERELVAAIAKTDLATYDRIVADDYVAYTIGGQESTKPEIMASYRTGTRRYMSLSISDVKVRVFGETAVLSARTSGTRIEEGGTPEPNTVRYFRVFTRRRGAWRAVMQMVMPLPALSAPERFVIRVPNAQLFFVPSTGAFRLAAAGATLSPCLDWRSFRVQDDTYQIRLQTSKDFFCRVSLIRLQAWRVRGAVAVFGRSGGEDTVLLVTMAKSSMPFSLVALRTVLKAIERAELQRLAQMIRSGQSIDRIREFSAEFTREHPDVDPESAVMDVSKEMALETAFENFDQKTNQLFNALSTVLKSIKETQSAISLRLMDMKS